MGEYFVYSQYKSIEASQNNGTTNTEYDMNETIKSPTALVYGDKIFITTDQTVTVRFNSTSNDGITVTAAQSPYKVENLRITKLFVSNASGSTANLKILVQGRGVGA